MDHINGLRYN